MSLDHDAIRELAADTAVRLIASIPEISDGAEVDRALLENLHAELIAIEASELREDNPALHADLIANKRTEIELILEEARLAAEWETIAEWRAWRRGVASALHASATAAAPLVIATLRGAQT